MLVWWLAGMLSGIVPTGCDRRAGEAAAHLDQASLEPPVRVLLGKLERGAVSNRLSVDADLEAVARADYSAEIPGVVRQILKREGDRLEAGEAVITLVDDELRLLVDNKRILHAQAALRVKQADVARREGEKLSRQKRILFDKTKAVYDRASKLVGGGSSGIISSEELEAKRYDLADAEIALQTAALAREKYELDYLQRIEEERLQAVELKTAEHNLSRTVLRSPIDGVLSYLRLKRGELVSTTQKAFSVVDLTKLEARLHVPQRELRRIRAGLDVVLECEVFPGREFRGTVEVVSPVVSERGTVEVLVTISDPSGFLKPGMFVNGDIILETRQDAVLVPKKAISYDNQQPIIFLVRDRRAYRYVVTPGFSTRDAIEVVALTASDGKALRLDDEDLGDLVVVGHDNLEDGSGVESESRAERN